MSNKAMFTLYRIGFCRYETFHFQQGSGAEQYCSGVETASKAAILAALSGTLPAMLRFTMRYNVNIALL